MTAIVVARAALAGYLAGYLLIGLSFACVALDLRYLACRMGRVGLVVMLVFGVMGSMVAAVAFVMGGHA